MFAFDAPAIDFHALAPELVLVGMICVMLLVDVVLLERGKALLGSLAGLGFLGALIPVLTLINEEREMFGGAYVVNNPTLLLKALFLVSAYVVVLLSTNYVAEGEYWESEYYTLLVCSVLGMTLMASSRDLITIFVSLELLSIPAYMLAAWRKADSKSNEAGMKYYLMGVFASAVLLYGMSLLYGLSGSTLLSEIATKIGGNEVNTPALTLGVIFTLIGFAFKVSAVPFHAWAPDTYEGAPTPVTAFLAVASKAAGFVALIQIISVGVGAKSDIIQPTIFVLSALSMTVGNLIALRQTNVVRMLAYSGIAQAGFILAPFVVVNEPRVATSTIQAVIVYLVLYAATNLGAFAVVIAMARKTGSAEISSFGGAFQFAPGLTLIMTIFLASFIGVPPFGAWYGKFGVMKVLIGAGSGWGTALAIVLAVNTAIAAYYYLNVAKSMWFDPPVNGDLAPVRVPVSLRTAMAITVFATVLFGVMPQIIDDAAQPVVHEAAVLTGPGN